jgi:hypothetical protein
MIEGVQLHAHAQGILFAHGTEGGAGACPNAANAQAHGRTLIHSQVVPDAVDIFFFQSDQGDAGGARDFHCLDLIFFRDVRKLPQQLRRHHTAGDMGGNGIGGSTFLGDGAFFTDLQHGVPPYVDHWFKVGIDRSSITFLYHQWPQNQKPMSTQKRGGTIARAKPSGDRNVDLNGMGLRFVRMSKKATRHKNGFRPPFDL